IPPAALLQKRLAQLQKPGRIVRRGFELDVAAHAVRAHNPADAQIFRRAQTISTAYLPCSRALAALTTVRMALAMRPCLPMTLPISPGATCSSITVQSPSCLV